MYSYFAVFFPNKHGDSKIFIERAELVSLQTSAVSVLTVRAIRRILHYVIDYALHADFLHYSMIYGLVNNCWSLNLSPYLDPMTEKSVVGRDWLKAT